MNKIQELIEKLCPDGVEYKRIGDIANVLRGKRLTKDKLNADNGYPVYHGGLEPLGYYHEMNRKANTVMVINVGASAGTVGFCDVDFWSSDGCYCISHNNFAIPKYIYSALASQEQLLVSKVRRAGIPTLDAKIVEDIKIPVPPLEIQSEIVRILDNFTELTAELTAELTVRKKQYEYYRDELFTFGANIKNVPLKEVVAKSCSGGTPTKGKSEYYDGGTIPWLRTQDVRFNEIYEINSFITDEAVRKTSAKWIPENCVIVAISGATAGRCAINKIPTTTNQHCLNLEIDSSKALYKYIFYCLCSLYEELINKKQGARGDLNSSLVLSLNIPLPSLEEQQRIVGILDRFDKLCNDISEGLPAEIEARQKQYEYYRDKLLTFKEKA